MTAASGFCAYLISFLGLGFRHCSISLIVVGGMGFGNCIVADAQTQGEMTKASCEVMKESEARLEASCKQILARNRADKVFLRNFEKAQRAWTTYRDLHIKSVYPYPDKAEKYGSVYDACRCELAAKLNEARLRQLEEWTIGVEEGDVCIGSRAVKR